MRRSKNISLKLLEAASPQAREDAIKVFKKYALVTRRPAESALDAHRLVHQALRKWLQLQGQLRQWTQHTITQLLQVFPNNDHNNRSKWRRLLPHAQYALSQIPADDNNEERLVLAWKCARTLYSNGRYKEAKKLFVQVIETRKTKLGEDHPSTLTSKANLASTYWNQGRWDDAEKLFVQVMETSKTKLGEDHPDTLTSIANLASTYRNQGRWDDAKKLEVQVMETRKTKLGEDHPSTLTSIANLAFTLQSQTRSREAFALMERCCQLREQVLGEQHPHTQSSLNTLTNWRAKCEQINKEDNFIVLPITADCKVNLDAALYSIGMTFNCTL
jgi:tetratricopeptide (TPR) repeat protein